MENSYMKFENLGLQAELLRAVKDEGYTTPTPVQERTIPLVLERRDILAGAQTGTGKTAAFTLPMLQILGKGGRGRFPRALILTPTRELAAQVAESVRTYGRHMPLRSAVVFGGVGIHPQIDKLRRGIDILVATPGRLLDHASQRTVNLSNQEAVDYFSQQVSERNVAGAVPDRPSGVPESNLDVATNGAAGTAGGATPSPNSGETATAEADAGSGDGAFSQTTTQEAGVDEADVVKTDGTNLYIITGDKLQIVHAAPPDGLALLSEVPLEGFGREIYLDGSTIVAITASFGGYLAIDVAVGVAETTDVGGSTVAMDEARIATPDSVDPGEFEYMRPQVFVTIIDASDPSSPTILSQTSFDGSQSSSRMIDGILYLAISDFESFFVDVLPVMAPMGPVAPGDPVVPGTADLDIETILPQFRQEHASGDVTEGPVLTWEDLYHPSEPDGYGVVSVISMDVRNDAAFTAVGVVAEPGLIYSSLEALYLTDTQWDFFGNTRETTSIYKLAYVDGAAVPVAAGQVPGRVLNQYSMGEHDGYLRVATTVGPVFSPFGVRSVPHNNVYVLDEVDGELAIVGSVRNIAAGETIQSARFVGDRGFLVTFEQIDPFFTLDLADPTNPVNVGKLKVPGFSTFIVPMDEDHLLTVGRYIPDQQSPDNRDVQLSIFNVSDFAHPVLQDHVVVNEKNGADSEALYDPKAFTYFAEGGMVALPVSIHNYRFIEPGVVFEDAGGVATGGSGVAESPPTPVGQTQTDGGGVATDPDETTVPVDTEPPPDIDGSMDVGEPFVPEGFDGLYVYQVSAETGFAKLGRISTRFNDDYFAGSSTRGIFIDNNVYAVTDIGIRAAPVDAIDSAPYELVTRDDSAGGGSGDIGIPEDVGAASSGGGGVPVDDVTVTDPPTEPAPE